MLILFVRAIILYALVFFIIRLSGKRQISDLQPFDLLATLLVADLASVPASDTSIPLMYGVIPILALFLIQHLVSILSLKFEGMRKLLCGSSLLVISHGVVQEQTLKDARYTLNDLMEQLRAKDVFELASVEFAILETNGQLSVLLKGPEQPLTCQLMQIPPPQTSLPFFLIQDGKVHKEALKSAGYDEKWLSVQLRKAGLNNPKDVLFAFLIDNALHLQSKARCGAKVSSFAIGGEKK